MMLATLGAALASRPRRIVMATVAALLAAGLWIRLGPIPADLLASYERIRSSNHGAGVARLIGNTCQGCRLTIPATEVDRIRHDPEAGIDESLTARKLAGGLAASLKPKSVALNT